MVHTRYDRMNYKWYNVYISHLKGECTMKRLACVVLAIILCLILPLSTIAAPKATPAPAAEKFKVTISYSAKMVANDHVGNSWTTYIEVGDTVIKKGKSAKVEVTGADTIKIICNAIENDKSPDHGDATIEIPIKDLKKGKNTFKTSVTVTEDKGRYSGNSAEWSFTVTVKK